jgi:hypothetical protein
VDEATLRDLLVGVRAGSIPADDAVRVLRRLPFGDLGFARVDHHRRLRSAMGEVVYGPGKEPGQCAAIVAELLAGDGGPVVLTRADDEQAVAALAANPGGRREGSTVVWRPATPQAATVVVATAGTSDAPVATECEAVLAAHGVVARRLNDVGVAGLHRLLCELDVLQEAEAVVVVAGMEGALPSVVGGLTGAPIIAVPTSTGYGAAFEGVTALLSMLASCAAGVTVVGIDNGFGAAAAVLRLLDGAAGRS